MKEKLEFKMPESLNRQIDDVDLKLAGGKVDIVLDFSPCGFISVEGLEWLEELLLRASSSGAKVELLAVPPSIYKVFKIARIDRVLEACGGAAASGPAC